MLIYCIQDRGALLSCDFHFNSDLVRALIPSEIRSVVRRASFHSKYGCSKPSTAFNGYVYNLLNNGTFSEDDFNSCHFIPQLQVALNYTSNSTKAVSSFADLVVLAKDSPLYSRLHSLWGNETDFTGEFLLKRFGSLSVSETRLMLAKFFCSNESTNAMPLSNVYVPYSGSEVHEIY